MCINLAFAMGERKSRDGNVRHAAIFFQNRLMHEIRSLKKVVILIKNEKPLAVDIYSGAGGLSKGLELAGFSVKLAVDLDEGSAKTYQCNHTATKFIKDDIKNINGRQLLKEIGLTSGDLDILIGGPPCQGFSASNTKTRNMSNPNNHLVFEYIRIASEIKPKWVLMENVAGLESFENGSIRNQIIQSFTKIGYSMRYAVLNAANFGVPQNRNRIFFIGNCEGSDLDFLDEMRKLNPPTVRDAISDLPDIENGNTLDKIKYKRGRLSKYQKLMRADSNGTVKNNCVSRNSELVIERYKYIEPGENWSAVLKKRPDLLFNYKDTENCHSGIYKRLEWDKPSVAITHFRKSMLIHPEQNRGLSVREAARIQSFPDDYIFYSHLGSQQQQAANAVPPMLAKAVGAEIVKLLT